MSVSAARREGAWSVASAASAFVSNASLSTTESDGGGRGGDAPVFGFPHGAQEDRVSIKSKKYGTGHEAYHKWASFSKPCDLAPRNYVRFAAVRSRGARPALNRNMKRNGRQMS